MRDKRVRLGIVLGLLAAPFLFVFRGAGAGPGTALSDCDGQIREIVIQYASGAAPISARAYRDFLRALPDDVIVNLVAPSPESARELTAAVGDVPPEIRVLATGHPMTTWARDRWLALRTRDGVELLLPSAEDGEEVWPERSGDARIGLDLAGALADLTARRSSLGFDGGDFVADSETVFVTPRVALRNGGQGLKEALEAELGRRVVVLELAPPYHAGMYMMTAGDRRVLVGDPSLAAPLLVDGADPNPVGSDVSQETCAAFDAVARRCEAEGYRVTRIPVLPGVDGRTWLTPLNVIIDERPEGRVVYMPVYRGAEALNEAAAAIWRGLGFEVRPVDCTEPCPYFGSLRCLVGVIRRDD